MTVIEQIFFLPPMAVARLGGSDSPLESFVWVEDPATHGAGNTVIQPAITLHVQQDGSVQPALPTEIPFRDGKLLRPVAPFFELWAKVTGQADPVPLTSALLASSGGSLDGVTYTVSVGNRKAARRTGDDSCAYTAQITAIGNDHDRHPLLASSQGDQPLVFANNPIPLGQFQAILPTPGGTASGIDLDQLRVRFTPATGQVYGAPGATSDADPETGQQHEMVPAANRILNPASSWVGYDPGTTVNNPVPADTYDGADRGRKSPSFGVVDDTCDGLIEAVVVAGGARLRASARVFCAPPDYAPDRRPFVSLADDLIDRDPPSVEPPESPAEALERLGDLFQRAYETASLTNVDATRQRSIGANQGSSEVAGTPKILDDSLTPNDPPYYRKDQTDIPAPTREAQVPFHDTAVEMHGPLTDTDDLAVFLREHAAHVKDLIRPPYGAFRELAANPSPTDPPNPQHRDPRITRDSLHDMRMPPYMIDSDGGSMSLTRRQYTFLMKLVDQLQLQPGAADSQPLPTSTNAHVAKVVARRKKRKP